MSAESESERQKGWRPADLLALPMDERDRILSEAADRAAIEYETDPELTDFHA